MTSAQKQRCWSRTLVRGDQIDLLVDGQVVATIRTRKRAGKVSVQVIAVDSIGIQYVAAPAVLDAESRRERRTLG